MKSTQNSLLDLTADQILGINAEDPEKLFKPSAEAITGDFRALAQKWHTDHNKDPKAREVLEHLLALRTKAQEKLDKKTWQEAGYFTCQLSNGKTFRARSDASHKFELGTVHISPTTATYVVDKAYADLFANAVEIFGTLKFSDDKMKNAYAQSLPTVFKTYETPDSLILTIRKNEDHILLRDLQPLIPKEKLDLHTAWITSRLHEMVRYLDYAGITHNAITLDNVFVSPRDHTIGLFGGWWYATPFNKTLKAIPVEAEEFLSDEALATRRPDPAVDLEMIRAAGRELLGDRGGTRLPALKPAPGFMLDYLRLPTSGNAQRDLEQWYRDVLKKSFGVRRFTELPVTYDEVYQQKGGSMNTTMPHPA